MMTSWLCAHLLALGALLALSQLDRRPAPADADMPWGERLREELARRAAGADGR